MIGNDLEMNFLHTSGDDQNIDEHLNVNPTQ